MFVNSFGQKKIAANGEQQKQDEHAARFKIKKQTKHKVTQETELGSPI